MRPIRFSKKEWGLAVLSVCLALASLRPQDAVVFVPMLIVSWIAVLYLVYHHEGKRPRKALLSLTATVVLTGIAYNNLSDDSRRESIAARMDVTNVIPVPARSHKGNGLFVNVFYANHGKFPIERMAHRCVIQHAEQPLSHAQEAELMATADALPFPKDLSDAVEIEPGDYPKHFFSCEQGDEEIIGARDNVDVLTTNHRLYVAVVMKYQDDRTPQNKVIMTEFCGWFNGTFEMWHNCGRNRVGIQPIESAR